MWTARSTSPRRCRRPAAASAFLRSIISSMRSSSVPAQMNLRTCTLRDWPMRNARSVAWSSTAGFHQRSTWMTWLAAVRLRPVPAALSESRKIIGSSSVWNRLDQLVAPLLGQAAVQPQHRPVEMGREVRLQQRAELGVLGEDQGLVALGDDLFGQLLEAGQLAGAPGQPGAVAQQVGGVVADLLEPGHRGQHVAPALDALAVLDLRQHVVDDGLVERGLLGRERCTRPSSPASPAGRR